MQYVEDLPLVAQSKMLQVPIYTLVGINWVVIEVGGH